MLHRRSRCIARRSRRAVRSCSHRSVRSGGCIFRRGPTGCSSRSHPRKLDRSTLHPCSYRWRMHRWHRMACRWAALESRCWRLPLHRRRLPLRRRGSHRPRHPRRRRGWSRTPGRPRRMRRCKLPPSSGWRAHRSPIGGGACPGTSPPVYHQPSTQSMQRCCTCAASSFFFSSGLILS
jgi:hypothetical protein